MSKISEKVYNGGIIGAGGAGFPTHIKLNGDIKTIIINGAECEPLLQVDKSILKRYASEIVEGLNFVMKSVGALKGIIGIKNKYKDVINTVNGYCSMSESIEVKELPNVYPIGDEVVLIEETTGIVVEKGGLPINYNIVVMNVETLLNIYKKEVLNQNVTHTYVTISGEVENQGTYYVPIGMGIKELLDNYTMTKVKDYEVVIGGPMTGIIGNELAVVKKTTKAIIVLEKNHSLIRNMRDVNINHLKRIMATCSQCRACTDMCPRNLLGHQVQPHLLMNAMANGLVNNVSVLETALGCVNCGVCELYACHHDLSPRKMMVMVKDEFARNGIRASGKDCIPIHKDRDYRRVPADRLVMHLGLSKYNHQVPFYEDIVKAEMINMPLGQHIGRPAEPCVQVGEMVKVNDLIGKGVEGSLSANIHASIDGVVKEVTSTHVKIERV